MMKRPFRRSPRKHGSHSSSLACGRSLLQTSRSNFFDGLASRRKNVDRFSHDHAGYTVEPHLLYDLAILCMK